MDANLVSNLRSTAAFLEQFDEAAVTLRAPWLDQAADEIERLRAALRNAEEALTDLPTNQECEGVKLAQKIIETALLGASK